MSNINKVSEARKYSTNPFIGEELFQIDKGKKTVIAGTTKQVLVDTDTGNVEGITLLNK